MRMTDKDMEKLEKEIVGFLHSLLYPGWDTTKKATYEITIKVNGTEDETNKTLSKITKYLETLSRNGDGKRGNGKSKCGRKSNDIYITYCLKKLDED